TASAPARGSRAGHAEGGASEHHQRRYRDDGLEPGADGRGERAHAPVRRDSAPRRTARRPLAGHRELSAPASGAPGRPVVPAPTPGPPPPFGVPHPSTPRPLHAVSLSSFTPIRRLALARLISVGGTDAAHIGLVALVLVRTGSAEWVAAVLVARIGVA